MFRVLSASFYLVLSVSFFWTLYRLETFLRRPGEDIYRQITCTQADQNPALSTISEKHSSPAPVVTSEIKATIKLVRLCQGLAEREMLDDEGNIVSVSVPRTIIFFRSDEGHLDIITARVTNARDQNFVPTNLNSRSALDLPTKPVKDLGLVAEHGLLEDLKAIDEATEATRYPQLLDEAAELCLGEYSSMSQFDADAEKLKNEIEGLATAYISMDYDLNSPDTQILLYFKVNGKIYQQDLSGLSI